MDSHVILQLIRLRPRWWLPARLLGGSIEVGRKVLGVGMADFPAVWKTSLCLFNCFTIVSVRPKWLDGVEESSMTMNGTDTERKDGKRTMFIVRKKEMI